MNSTTEVNSIKSPSESSALNYGIFQEPWWLDTVAPNSWEDITLEKKGSIIARWPLIVKRKGGITYLTYPPLTPRLGPALLIRSTNPAERIAATRGMLQELIEKLPSYNSFEQNFTTDITYWLPFFWAGFELRPRCTYQLINLSDQESLWRNMRDTLRNSIKKAQKSVEIECGGEISDLISSLRMTFGRQSLRLPFSEEIVRNIVNECRRRKAGEIFVAKDSRGRVHAAALIVWDRETAYYLLGGSDPDLRSSGALSLLLWSAIQHCTSIVSRFDFEGSLIEPIERFFSSFGALPVTYYHVRKKDKKATAIDLAKGIVGMIRNVRSN